LLLLTLALLPFITEITENASHSTFLLWFFTFLTVNAWHLFQNIRINRL
jgi:uncharacterized membrane protein